MTYHKYAIWPENKYIFIFTHVWTLYYGGKKKTNKRRKKKLTYKTSLHEIASYILWSDHWKIYFHFLHCTTLYRLDIYSIIVEGNCYRKLDGYTPPPLPSPPVSFRYYLILRVRNLWIIHVTPTNSNIIHDCLRS